MGNHVAKLPKLETLLERGGESLRWSFFRSALLREDPVKVARYQEHLAQKLKDSHGTTLADGEDQSRKSGFTFKIFVGREGSSNTNNTNTNNNDSNNTRQATAASSGESMGNEKHGSANEQVKVDVKKDTFKQSDIFSYNLNNLKEIFNLVNVGMALRMKGAAMAPLIPSGAAVFCTREILPINSQWDFVSMALKTRSSEKLSVNDVVAFKNPQDPSAVLIRRVKGIPGSRIISSKPDQPSFVLKPLDYWLEKDNPNDSGLDSVKFGPVPRELILGVVVTQLDGEAVLNSELIMRKLRLNPLIPARDIIRFIELRDKEANESENKKPLEST